MDKQLVQEARRISLEIVKKEFPDEEKNFDFIFDLIIQVLEELELGKETEKM